MEEDIDSFLYGGTDNAIPINNKPTVTKQPSPAIPTKQQSIEKKSDQQTKEEHNYEEEEEEEEEEEDVEIVLESTEPTPTTSNQPDLSTGGFLKMSAKPTVSTGEGQSTTGPSSSTIDIGAIAMLDGESLLDIDIEGFDEKPWRKPGADITDYFNFGFNEVSWKQYCYKQKQLREEFSSGSYGPVQGKTGATPTPRPPPSAHQGQRSPRIHSAQPEVAQSLPFQQQQRYSHEDSSKRDEPRGGAQRRPNYSNERDRQVYKHRSRSRSRSRDRYRTTTDRKRSHDAVEGSRERDSAARRRRVN